MINYNFFSNHPVSGRSQGKKIICSTDVFFILGGSNMGLLGINTEYKLSGSQK